MLKTVLAQLLLGGSVLAQVSVGDTSASTRESSPSSFRLERQPVANGAELVTLFGRLHDPDSGIEGLDVPLLSVLRDSLGDADQSTDRLRYVWILTNTRPTPLQRAASALSFVVFRTPSKRHANGVPPAILDLASPAKTVWPNLMANGVQSMQLDPLGVLVRACTRSYRGNSSDYRKLQIFQALGALDGLSRQADGHTLLPDSEHREIYARLSLSDRALGGLVRRENLTTFYDKDQSRREQMRGHNWELLRQRAELCGLYFEPLALPDREAGEALLWVALEDLEQRQNRHFDRQFLNIANPWTDDRLMQWTGYTQVRYLDSDNRVVSAGMPGARAVEMIPLALYSLDHPKAPLLLADFRDTFTPKRRELVRHGATTVITGVFGITRFGNWPFFAASSAWTFVRGRHGAAVDRSARLNAYSDAREFLALDTRLEPRLKAELSARLDHLAMNPRENCIEAEAKVAQDQYAALLRYAQSPTGLAARLERDRRIELQSYTQPKAQRLLAAFGRIFTRGPRVDAGEIDETLHMRLAAYRRAAQQERFLEQLLATSPRPEVIWNGADVRESIEALAADPGADSRAPGLIATIFARSGDYEIRLACLRALRDLNVEQARNELLRLSQDPTTSSDWRAICLAYFKSDAATALAPVPGGAQ